MITRPRGQRIDRPCCVVMRAPHQVEWTTLHHVGTIPLSASQEHVADPSASSAGSPAKSRQGEPVGQS